MNKFFQLLAAALLISVTACRELAHEENKKDTLTQISTIDALLDGVYEGALSCGQIKQYGNFGLGTFDNLDGEMIILNGKIFKASVDGKVYEARNSWKTPFTAVTFFEKSKSFTITTPLNFEKLKKKIDKYLDSNNTFYAVKITGTFKKMKVRSVPPQKKPYPPLKEVVKHQKIFNLDKCRGTIIGFKCPAFVKGLNVTGYHMHFLSYDMKKGGHILDLETDNVKVEIDSKNRFLLILPELNSFKKSNLEKDRTSELEKVEK
jgi:acetolactate decarboxylase